MRESDLKKENKRKYKSIFYVIVESLKDIGSFRSYLIENTEKLICFHFPHGYSKIPSYMEIYENGVLTLKHSFYRYKGSSNVIKLVLYYFYFNYIVFRYVPRGTFVIVEKPIYCVLSRISSFLKNLKFVFWIGDYFPYTTGIMSVYNFLVSYYNRNLGHVIYESPPVEGVYGRMFRKTKRKGKFRKVITLGMKKNFLKIKTRIKRKVPLLGFIGVIREQQGLDLIFKFLGENREYKFEIVGTGYELEHYKNLAKELGIIKQVKFYGPVENVTPIFSNWDIAIALYENSDTNVSTYCEPTKIKHYLEYGLPVITTKTTYFYKELLKYHAGVTIEETTDSLMQAIKKISGNYSLYTKGVEKLISEYEYRSWYDSHWSFLQK